MKYMIGNTTDNKKIVEGEDYNYVFNKKTGDFARWGKTLKDNPQFSPIGPEILDIEITTICNGVDGRFCSTCYKSNTGNGQNMSYNDFVSLLNKVNENKQLTQLAFGLGSTGIENPDIWRMCEYARNIDIIPNGTVADISDETADNIVKWFGACAVSNHSKEACYNSVKRLTDRGLEQTNIHAVIYKENIKETFELIDDIKNDARLSKLRAVVFLSLKKAGRAEKGKTPLSQDEFNSLMEYAFKKKINFGMDSCSAPKFLNFLKDNPKYMYTKKDNIISDITECIEPCESTCFSVYIDVFGNYHPCSFCEHKKGLTSINIHNIGSFTKDVWLNEKVIEFRKMLLKNNRNCPIFEV